MGEYGKDLVTSGGHQIVRVSKGVIRAGAWAAVAGAALGTTVAVAAKDTVTNR